MDFRLPEELAIFRRALRRFVDSVLIPLEGQTIEDGRLKDSVHAELCGKARQAGLWHLEVPERLGGQELSTLALTVFWEEVSRTTALPPRDQSIFGPMVGPILMSLEGQLAERFLIPVLQGKKRPCFAQTEPGAGSDPAGMKTRAVRHGDHYVITGSKHFITDADRADFAQVLAVTNPAKGARGISCFLVEMDSEGVKLGRRQKTLMGERPSEIRFEAVKVPANQLVGGEGEGFKLAQSWITQGRIRHGARGCGVAERCLELGTRYAQQRRTFGAPLVDRQLIQKMLTDTYIELNAARLLVQQAAMQLDEGSDAKNAAYMAKVYGDEMSFRAADRCIQIHGGVGLTPDLPIEQFWRDQRGMLITEGPSEVLRMKIAQHVINLYGSH